MATALIYHQLTKDKSLFNFYRTKALRDQGFLLVDWY